MHKTPQELFESVRPMAYSVANRCRRKWGLWIEEDDAVQVALLGFWKAAQQFDQTRGIQFSTYAFIAATRRIGLEVKIARRRGFRFPPPDGSLAVQQFGVFEPAARTDDAPALAIKREHEARVKAVADKAIELSRRNESDQQTPEILWRLANGEKLREIAPTFGVSRERIRQIADAGRRRARAKNERLYRELCQ